MVICSGVPGNECRPISVPNVQYDEYHECIIYGYDFSSNLLKSLLFSYTATGFGKGDTS